MKKFLSVVVKDALLMVVSGFRAKWR